MVSLREPAKGDDTMALSVVGEALDIALKLPELGRKLYELIEIAKGSSVESKVMLYLQVAQRAIRALGRERQRILVDAAGCDVRNRHEVEALSRRMRVYLQEDSVRDPFTRAIEGLKGCKHDIERAAQGLGWRKKDKQRAVQAFLSTLDDLDTSAKNLEYAFFPKYSGQGLGTLVPLYDFISSIEANLRRGLPRDTDCEEERLAELIGDALRDPAQTRWIQEAAHIERLVVELQLAFAIKEGSEGGAAQAIQ